MSDEAKFREAIAFLEHVRSESGVDIGGQGKLYSMVKDRVALFRSSFGSKFGIRTSVDYDAAQQRGFGEDSVVVGIAQIINRNGDVMASGHAMERINAGNNVSWFACIEAVETAAIGRALACFGLHGGEYASDAEMDKMNRATNTPSPPPPPAPDIPRGQSKAPPPMPVQEGFYDPPTDPEEYGANAARHNHGIVHSLKSITNLDDLAHYWAGLEGFRRMLKTKDRKAYDKMGDMFAAKDAELKGAISDE